MTTLSTLQAAPGSTKARKRVGRGSGSGHGKTSSRGHKGQKARSGGKTVPGFEGGQMPLQRRLPKRGFTNIFKIVYQVLNVQDLNTFPANTVVTAEALRAAGKVRSLRRPLKILGTGDIGVALTVQADKFSQTARQKIVAAGGVVEEKSA